MVADEIGGSPHIHQAPTISIIRAGISPVSGSVNEESLEGAGPHGLTGEEQAVLLDEKRGGTCRIRSGHAGAAQGGVGGVAAAGG